MPLNPLVSVLVVYLTRFAFDQNIVCPGDLDELLVCAVVAGVLVRVVLFGEGAVGFFDLAVRGVFVDLEELVEVFGAEGEEGEEAE